MKLSTRSRYGARLMFEFALHHGEGYVRLGDAAKRQGMSEKYLSKLVIPLRAAGFINSARGFQGGYVLARNPEEITLGQIVETLEGNIAPVDCVGGKASCRRSGTCPARDIWCGLAQAIKDSLNKVSLQDMVNQFRSANGDSGTDYCI